MTEMRAGFDYHVYESWKHNMGGRAVAKKGSDIWLAGVVCHCFACPKTYETRSPFISLDEREIDDCYHGTRPVPVAAQSQSQSRPVDLTEEGPAGQDMVVVENRGSLLSRPSYGRRLASNSQPGGQRMAAVSVGDKHVQSSVSRATVDHLYAPTVTDQHPTSPQFCPRPPLLCRLPTPPCEAETTLGKWKP
ncbi:hypothetical protein B0T13DRAFT_531266 [Neurospora crassa]|nr:hypothetical protein B0T13DRAFT_531266 [Neurospora crassa]